MDKEHITEEKDLMEEYVEEIEGMEIPKELINLDENKKRKLHKFLQRRYFAIHMLQRASRYAEGYMDDFVISIQLDRKSLNPKLIIEVKMDQELPMDIAPIVYKYLDKLTEIFDWLNMKRYLSRRRKARETKEFRWREGQEQYLQP